MRIVTWGHLTGVQFWDAKSGKELPGLQGEQEVTIAELYSGEANVGVRSFEIKGYCGPINAVVFSPDGRLVAVASEDSSIGLWDVATGKRIADLAGHTGSVASVAFSADGRRLVSGAKDFTLRVWEVPKTSVYPRRHLFAVAARTSQLCIAAQNATIHNVARNVGFTKSDRGSDTTFTLKLRASG